MYRFLTVSQAKAGGEDGNDDDDNDETLAAPDVVPTRPQNGISNSRARGTAASKSAEAASAAESNPWLVDVDSVGPARKKNAVSNSAESKAVRALKKAVNQTAGPDSSPSAAGAQARSSGDDGDEEDEQSLMPVDKAASNKQRELIAAAFAGDNVIDVSPESG